MSSATSNAKTIDVDAPDTVRMDAAEAAAVGMRALKALGYPEDEAKISLNCFFFWISRMFRMPMTFVVHNVS